MNKEKLLNHINDLMIKYNGNIEKYHFCRGIKTSISAMSEKGAEYIHNVLLLLDDDCNK